jgi:hypothetical protein
MDFIYQIFINISSSIINSDSDLEILDVIDLRSSRSELSLPKLAKHSSILYIEI